MLDFEGKFPLYFDADFVPTLFFNFSSRLGKKSNKLRTELTSKVISVFKIFILKIRLSFYNSSKSRQFISIHTLWRTIFFWYIEKHFTFETIYARNFDRRKNIIKNSLNKLTY